MKCPFCHQEVSDGKFCSNCSKPLYPKWYQKNSPLTITIMIVSIIFFIGCLCFSMSISNNDNEGIEKNNNSITTETNQTKAQKTYSSILGFSISTIVLMFIKCLNSFYTITHLIIGFIALFTGIFITKKINHLFND